MDSSLSGAILLFGEKGGEGAKSVEEYSVYKHNLGRGRSILRVVLLVINCLRFVA